MAVHEGSWVGFIWEFYILLHSNQCLINNNAPYRINKLTSCTNYKLNDAKYTFGSVVLVYMYEGDWLINN